MNSPVPLEALAVAPDSASVTDALPAYRDFLAGRGAIIPVSADTDGHHLAQLMGVGPGGRPEPSGTLIACTSGSTGTPKGALLRTSGVRAAISASASFIKEYTGHGPGPWLLALPPHHIAGTMVILRSLDAGYAPEVTAPGRFTAATFATATDRLTRDHPDLPIYTSLVPAQLIRLLDDPVGTAALQHYAAVLVGGGPTPSDALERCRQAGITILLTYGSSETAGGVVYNGEPLPGYQVSLTEGRVILAGPSVADGYRPTTSSGPTATAESFPRPGTFRTSDLGELHDGALTVLGRADGAVNSGGLKILPEQVEEALAEVGVTACAVGIPDRRWGEAVAVLIEQADSSAGATTGTGHTARLRDLLAAHGAPAHLTPKYAFTTGRLPVTGPGKIDRMRVREILEELTSGH